MPRMITVLEDCVRYRDGKKWKRRHCFLSKSDSKKGTITMFITKQFGIGVFNQEIDEKSLRQYLIDEITGFEHGRHVDKESHVMALIGCNMVYCIAFEQTETMFRWAETLSKLFMNVNFHVTLKKVSETSGLFNKICVGTQGNLHVQQNRLCLIGEPADGNKFICEWLMTNLISIDIHDTALDKVKRLQIKSNGKSNKGKGHFEFEISLTQKSVFEETFTTFLTACEDSNYEFKTNFIMKADSSEISTDNAYSYSIICNDKTGSNSENSSSLEKRSSEIPIPRSREHSGPDQRPIENVQIKIRKSQKNLQKVKNEIQKHYSTIETVGKHDNDDICLFPDDEEIEDQVHHRSHHLMCRGLSQESSGVCVSGPSDSMKDADLSVHISVHDDSGCGNLSSNPLQSTSSDRHDIGRSSLPPYRNVHCQTPSVFLKFYRDVCRNPLSLNNYTNYYRLLTTVFNKGSQLLKRSNSFNCIYVPEIKRFEFSRKYSNVNFPLNLTNKTSVQFFKLWKDKISRDTVENAFLPMNLKQDKEDLSKLSLSNRLPFRSMKEFHGAMMRSLQSGTVCFNMFSYHHFLSLLNDVKAVIKNIEVNKLITGDVAIEYRNLRDRICRKSKVYNRWLEKIQSYSSSFDGIELSIIDINILFSFQIMDSVLRTKSGFLNNESDASIPRHKSYFDTNRDKLSLSGTYGEHLVPGFNEFRPILTTSLSTPDFRDYCQHERVHKLSNIETGNQNLSSLDTFDVKNDAFSKHNAYPNKPITSDHKEGSFKRFRRKCSPNVFFPFIRRKTSSIHSTVSEPICHNDTKEQNSYYNIANQRDFIPMKCLSVVLDNCHYINTRQGLMSGQTSENSGTTRSIDYSDYANIDPSMCDDKTSYPDEIMDPSINYGDLNFIKSGKRYKSRHDSHTNNWQSFRRSSLSILSHKSLQNYGTSRSSVASFNRRGYSNNISRIHSDASHDTHNRFRSTDYINTKTLSSSPLSMQSCCAGQTTNVSQQRTVPRSLNYVTVVEHSTCNNFSPLQIITHHDLHHDHDYRHDSATVALDLTSNNNNNNASANCCISPLHTHSCTAATRTYAMRTWLTPPSSPIVDYCQIDLKGTYALRDVDRRLHDKKTARNNNSHVQRRSPSPDNLFLHSFPSLERLSDKLYSLSSSSFASCCTADKRIPARNKRTSKRSLRRLFSRKCGFTN